MKPVRRMTGTMPRRELEGDWVSISLMPPGITIAWVLHVSRCQQVAERGAVCWLRTERRETERQWSTAASEALTAPSHSESEREIGSRKITDAISPIGRHLCPARRQSRVSRMSRTEQHCNGQNRRCW